MSTLVAVSYPDQATAEEVRGVLAEAMKEKLITLEDAVVVTRDAEGKIKLHQAVNTVGTGAAGGAVWGGIIGLIFLAPLLGMAIGAASGAAAGALTDVGVDDNFLKDLGNKLEPGSAALIVLVKSVTPDKILERIQPYGGQVLQSSLTNDAEERLQAALSGTAA
jgi:uncharacterized membrane protein